MAEDPKKEAEAKAKAKAEAKKSVDHEKVCVADMNKPKKK